MVGGPKLPKAKAHELFGLGSSVRRPFEFLIQEITGKTFPNMLFALQFRLGTKLTFRLTFL